MTNSKLTVMSIKSKIKAIENYNGQLGTIQARTQEAYTLIHFALDNGLIGEYEATGLMNILEETYKKTLETATLQKIIQF